MVTEPVPQWQHLTRLEGFYAELQADLLVAALHGSGIDARRLPAQQPLSALVVGFPGALGVEVVVPAEQVAEARELLAEQPPPRVPQPLRVAARWWLVSMVGAGGAAALLNFEHAAEKPWLRLLGWGLLIVAAFTVRALVACLIWLHAEHRPLSDARVLVAAVLCLAALVLPLALLYFGALALLGALDQVSAAATGQNAVVFVAVLLLLIVAVTRWRHRVEQRRHRPADEA